MTNDQALTVGSLVQKLIALGITCQYKHLEEGPIVTTYYFTLDSSVPIAKIMKAEEDLALATDSPSVLVTRIGAKIAIAIPNKEKTIVSYDSCVHSMLLGTNYKLPILLGVDVRGIPKAFDLVESPHILIAGSTGGGKSVLLSAIISGLVTAKTKAEMKLILVDTKQLDLTLFAHLPHVVNVADDLQKVRDTLDRLLDIVRQRTAKMRGIARNIAEYNALADKKLPYYVVVIDELADVLMQDRSQAKGQRGYEKAETKLQSLLQICRAAGIHVICATQRPSVEIITGDIKANIPVRIALRLPSYNDSRTVLNEGGAEKLLGKGDMLVEAPFFDQITRFHGPYVSMEHIANVLINCDSIRDSYKQLQLQ